MRRREFLVRSLAAAAGVAASRVAEASPTLKFGHRQANMVAGPGPAVFDAAARIGGLAGIELQVYFKGTTLGDEETRAVYRRAAQRTGLAVPSLAGVWPPGAGLMQPGAEESVRKAIAAAASLGAATILVASFGKNCPVMSQEASYGPVVTLLQRVSAAARDAGVAIGLETSNSPADDRTLIDLVGSPSVGVYYDLDNVEQNGHTGQAVPGIALLECRVRQVHLKNGDRLLEEPGRVAWADALKGLAAAGYRGWLVFETSHSNPQQCAEATRKNIAFVTRCLAS